MTHTKLLIALAATVVLAGCTTTKVVTRTEYVMVPPPSITQPAAPTAVNMRDLQWKVLTRGELQAALDDLDKNPNPDFALFALTPKGFENLALNMNEIKRYIQEQKQVIAYYHRVTAGSQALQVVPTPTAKPKS